MDIQKKFLAIITRSLVFFLFLSLLGCATEHHRRPPVRDIWHQPLKSTTTYKVQAGDTLYSIAWAYGLDYRQVAAANGITPPTYHIEVGKKIVLIPANSSVSPVAHNVQAAPPPPVKPVAKKVPQQTTPIKPITKKMVVQQQTKIVTAPPQLVMVQTVQHDGIAWAWPAQGKLICMFSSNDLHKGIEIAGKSGAPVLAAAAGKVVYASNGLRGYGLLIIIKHNDDYLSAYAHNQKLLVTEGQNVRVGQVIAKMGATEARRVMLHFEIRKAGKPVDPLQYLPKR
jgi:lipoprotein NlpD